MDSIRISHIKTESESCKGYEYLEVLIEDQQQGDSINPTAIKFEPLDIHGFKRNNSAHINASSDLLSYQEQPSVVGSQELTRQDYQNVLHIGDKNETQVQIKFSLEQETENVGHNHAVNDNSEMAGDKTAIGQQGFNLSSSRMDYTSQQVGVQDCLKDSVQIKRDKNDNKTESVSDSVSETLPGQQTSPKVNGKPTIANPKLKSKRNSGKKVNHGSDTQSLKVRRKSEKTKRKLVDHAKLNAEIVSLEINRGNEKSNIVGDKCTMCYKDVQCKHHETKESNGNSNKKFQCDVCGSWFKHTYTLRKHKCNHEGKYVCSICNKRYGLPSYLKRHMKNHTDEKVRYHCKYCDKGLCSTSSLRAHERLHTLDKPFKCDVCEKCFTQSSNLATHKKIHNDVKPYVCELCNKPFRHKQSLLVHLRSHTKERPYTCATCGQTFTQNTHMRTHERLHSGIKPYKCNLCDKTFSRKHHLDYHLETHSGKTYKCSICDKAFTAERAVIQHERIHTGETPYKCDVCGKEFKYHGYLSVHKRIHTGDMPFKCSFCPKEFIVASSLQQHLKHNHHNETKNYLSAKRTRKMGQERIMANIQTNGSKKEVNISSGSCVKTGKRFKANFVQKKISLISQCIDKPNNAEIIETVAAFVNGIKSTIKKNNASNLSTTKGKTKQSGWRKKCCSK